ncbi:MAG: RICIN domain-containing protein [Muribaculaceae bacterium]|nr:RICIN domain-containing protein [Muribaculaceae bacterium]
MKKTLLLLLFLTFVLSAGAFETGKTYGISQDTRAAFIPNAEPASGRGAVMWSDTEVPAQRWLLEKRDDGTYTFLNQYTNLYLGISRSGAGATVDQRYFSIFQARWIIEESGEGYLLVPSENPELCVAAESGNEGAALKLVEKAGADPALSVFKLNPEPAEVPTAFTPVVRDAIMEGFLGQYYHKASTGHVLGGGGWWGDAEMFETILDAFATTGDLRYKEIFHGLYTNFIARNGSDWSGNEYNDDITWMVLACIRGYKYFGTADYLTKAKDNYTRMYNRAKQRFGTLIWKQSQENKLSTNSCINCPATVAACYLGQLTGDKTWFEKAVTIYTGQRKLLFNPDNGDVWDCRAWNSDGTMESGGNRWVSTYNQGTMLGAAVALYEYTKDDMYLQDAHKIYQRSVSSLTNSNKIIHVCQTINGDLCGFKGILMRYVRAYAESQHLEEPMQWMEKNAWHAYQNRNSNGVIWSAWLTKTSEDLTRMEGNDLKNITNDAFGSSTAVSVAFNAHVNRQFSKSATEGLEAINFDDIQFMQIDDEMADGTTPNTTATSVSNGYICFRNVDFGTTGLNNAIVRINATGSRSYIKVYVDSISDDTMLGRNEGFLAKGWQNVSIDTDSPLTGSHDVYVQFIGQGVQFHNMRFTADGAGVTEITAGAKCPMTVDGRVLTVNSEGSSKLDVYNVIGSLEKSLQLETGEVSVELQPGVHIIRLTTSSHENYTLKAIIK